MNGDDHYRTLGVTPDASAGDIREAYRRLARVHHPDHGRSDAAAMAAINEAYRVLGEPARRAVYDAARRGPASAATSAPPGARTAAVPTTRPSLIDDRPARMPWKLMAGMAAVGVAIVLVGTALYEPPGPRRPDNLLEPGSCVTIEANGDAREVTCTEGYELVVEVLVPTDDPCPAGTVGHRDRQGRGLACLTSVP